MTSSLPNDQQKLFQIINQPFVHFPVWEYFSFLEMILSLDYIFSWDKTAIIKSYTFDTKLWNKKNEMI